VPLCPAAELSRRVANHLIGAARKRSFHALASAYLEPVEVVVVGSDQIDAETRSALRVLWNRAFGRRFSDHDADHAYGGVHALGRHNGQLVSHASAVGRQMRFGDEPWRTVGYVEAVAVDPDRQGQGIGRRTMARLQTEISARWAVAMLSTGRATGFYETLGWERWRGLSYTQTGSGVVLDGEHGGLMVLRFDPAVVPDLSVGVTCEDRPGDAW
jgi:aminoglycoside 2'-N-acetyltransferase I